ncbi:hypothetical protein ECANGB1_1080 [Enterospora canceri]|uniref:Uncharacterized protein n=1 Tax=Enterospora canceri TaxID=1081671 RepID=A0A1Y1S7K8_9MICR|nr:hypothetical protein ECANGB1_1080 [Enterospora canceri]
MKFIEIGREVAMRRLDQRDHRAVVTGIIDNKFIVVQKQDRSNEVIRVDDIVLCDRVYEVDGLEAAGFYNEEKKEELNDFERYKRNLTVSITEELLRKSE